MNIYVWVEQWGASSIVTIILRVRALSNFGARDNAIIAKFVMQFNAGGRRRSEVYLLSPPQRAYTLSIYIYTPPCAATAIADYAKGLIFVLRSRSNVYTRLILLSALALFADPLSLFPHERERRVDKTRRIYRVRGR